MGLPLDAAALPSESRSFLRQGGAVVKMIFGCCVALSGAAVVSLSSAAGETAPSVKSHLRHLPHHVAGVAAPTLAQQAPSSAIPPFSWLIRLGVKPYPPGEGGADGLSRNIEDCNKGCIDVPIR
jgi:hypothetical protein